MIEQDIVGGVVLYIKEGIGFNRRENFPNEIENIFVDILLPKTKPILVGIIYNPFKPDFLDKLSSAITGTNNFDHQDVYILGDININLWHEGKYLFLDEKVLSPTEIHKIVKGNDAYRGNKIPGILFSSQPETIDQVSYKNNRKQIIFT